ncbi:MAG: SURF1 family protein [Halomonadaceae bacterium]|nr:MAG: SURF1 family protein [Halomonadaceae bacterium]
MISLGFWQLDRARQAAQEQARWESASDEANWPPSDPARGQPVSLAGEYQPRYQWLLDNRTRDGRRGYELYQLFQPVTGEPLVINRGWLPAPDSRDQLPTVATPQAPVVIEARLADWPQPPTMGASDPADSSGWPKRVQTLSQADVLAHSDPVSGYTVRLADSDQPGALQADWSPTSMGVASHRGYALQWFSMSVVLLTLTIATSFRKDPDSEDTDEQNKQDSQ